MKTVRNRRIRRGALAALSATALATFAAAAALLPAGSGEAAAARADTRSTKPFVVVGLTDRQRLVAFRSNRPNRVQKLGRVSGLVGDRALIGIDCRVKDSKLYGVGDQGGVYRIRLRDARATKVSQLTVPLQGTLFDIDWNPAANLLRIVSDTGQNLRHNLDNAAAPIRVGQTAADANLSIPPDVPVATGVTGAAYTNNDNDPVTATTLFALDTSRDQVAIQSPANAGLRPASWESSRTATPASTSITPPGAGAQRATGSPRSRSTAPASSTGSTCSPAVRARSAPSRPTGRSPTSPQAFDRTSSRAFSAAQPIANETARSRTKAARGHRAPRAAQPI
jgi:Domain of unknown function (DUF4394)